MRHAMPIVKVAAGLGEEEELAHEREGAYCGRRSPYFCLTQVKLTASSVLPVPVYRATCG